MAETLGNSDIQVDPTEKLNDLKSHLTPEEQIKALQEFLDSKEKSEQNATNLSEYSKQISEMEAIDPEEGTHDDYLKSMFLSEENNITTKEYLNKIINSAIDATHDAKITDENLSNFSSILNNYIPRILNGENIRKELFNEITNKIPNEAQYIEDALSLGLKIDGEEIDFEKALANFENNNGNYTDFEKAAGLDKIQPDYHEDMDTQDLNSGNTNNNNINEISYKNSPDYHIYSQLKELYQPGEIGSSIDIPGLTKQFGDNITNAIIEINANSNINSNEKIRLATEYILYKKGKIELNKTFMPILISKLDESNKNRISTKMKRFGKDIS